MSPHKPHVVPADLARAVSNYLTRVDRGNKGNALGRFVEDLEEVAAAAEAGRLPHRARTVGPTRGLANMARAFSIARHDLAELGTQGWNADGRGRAIIDAAATAAGWAAWTEFYREDDWSRSFVHHFAGGTVAGPTAPWHVDHLVLDVFVYGPNIDYPAHAHPAEEVYLILGGTAEFKIGADPQYRPLRAGDVTYHSPNLPHAIRIGEEPVVGVVMYRGDLEGPLWYRDDMHNENEEKRYPGVIRPD